MGLPSLAGVEALVHIHPVVRGLPIASFHCRVGFAPALCLAAALLDGTAKCPESLCPMSVFPHWGDVYAVSCEDITPRSSLLRTLALLSFGLSLVQEVSAGCFQPPAATGIFPTLSLRIFPRMLGPLPRRSHGVRIPVSSSVSSAFPQRGLGRLPASIREYDFSRGVFSRLQTFLYVQASEFARLPGRSYRCSKFRRAAETFTSGQNVLRCLCTHRIC